MLVDTYNNISISCDHTATTQTPLVRKPLPEFLYHWEHDLTLSYQEQSQLSAEEALQLFNDGDLVAPESQLLQLVDDFAADKTALNLLLHYLKLNNGDLSAAANIPVILTERVDGHPVHRLMRAFEEYWENSIEVAVLYLMSLFPYQFDLEQLLPCCQQAAKATSKKLFQSEDRYTCLMKKVKKLNGHKLERLVSRLSEQGFLTISASGQMILATDVQLYFQECFKKIFFTQWQRLNTWIYKDYLKRKESELISSSTRSLLACKALHHGSQAKLFEEAINDIYQPLQSILNQVNDVELEAECRQCLHELNLHLLRPYFQECWFRPAHTLSKNNKSFLLMSAGCSLDYLGYSDDAIKPLQHALAELQQKKSWSEVTVITTVLGKIYKARGSYDRSIEFHRQSAAYAALTKDHSLLAEKLFDLISLLQLSGHLKEARQLLEKVTLLIKHYRLPTERLAEVRQEMTTDSLKDFHEIAA